MNTFNRTLLSAVLALSLFSGCAKQPDAPKEVVVDATLPTVSVNGYITDMNAIAFEWKAVEDPRVSGFYVYRNAPNADDGKLNRIATVDSERATHFTDTTVIPNTAYRYRFSAFTAEGSESKASEMVNVTTLPVLTSVSFFHSIGNMPRSAKLIWRPHTNVKVKGYRVERQSVDDPEWKSIGTIDHRLSAEFIDSDLKDRFTYRYRILAETYDGIVSTPSDIVTVVTKPLPKVVANVTATTERPRSILITWDANPEKDISHYNIYRATSPNGSYDYHVKLTDTRFEDTIASDGTAYFYKVTAVDTDGLESPMSEAAVMGTSLVKPKAPTITEVKRLNDAAVLQWSNNDARSASFIVVKSTALSWFEKSQQEITGIKETQFTDMEIEKGKTYGYAVIAVDANGIRSEASEAVELIVDAE